MKKILLFIFISCLTNPLIAQTSIGFKNPKDIEPLMSYRLPTWGYSTILISADGRLNSQEAKSIYNSPWSRFSSNLSFSPKMYAYSESERNIKLYNIYSISELYYGANKSNPSSQGDRESKDIGLSLYLDGSWNYYFSENTFFLMSGNSSVRYREMINEDLYNHEENKRIDRSYELNAQIGFGWGRVRNVAPLIRALRFQERYGTVKNITPFNESQLHFIAHHIAKHSGYIGVHDRSDKYFWSDLFEGIGFESQLTPFEIYYLADIFKESIGARFQGWDFSTGLKITGNKNINRTLGWFMQSQWYRNLSLNHQISVRPTGYISKYLDDDAGQKFIGSVVLNFEYLWVLNDRILWLSRLNSNLNIGKTKKLNSENLAWYQHFYHNLESRFSYYIEDNLTFDLRTILLLSRMDKDFYPNYYRNNILFSIGINYYVDRKFN